MKNFFTLKYWFTINPGPLNGLGFNILLVLVALFFVLAMVSFVIKQKKSLYRGLISRIYELALSNFIIGLLFTFFYYENIPFFTARFWLLLWLIGIIIWALFIVKRFKNINVNKDKLEQEELRKKYLPN